MLHYNSEQLLGTHLGTYLSPHVQNLLVYLSQNCEKNSRKKQALLHDLTVDWAAVSELTGGILLDASILEQPKSYYEEALQSVWPVYHQIHSEFQEADHSRQKQLLSRLKWTEQSRDILSFYQQYSHSKSDTAKMILLLYLTSVLERSLGNICAATNAQVPFLLRDLLNMQELRDILGAVPSTFIQLLVGTPRGLNLRNVLWHGFAHPSEISDSLVTLLIVVIASIDALLNTQEFSVQSRKFFDLSRFEDVLKEDSDSSSLTSFVEDFVKNTDIVPPKFKSLWMSALHLCNNFRYAECCIILLPQIELLLRCVFCAANNLSSRLLTAEADTLYTTLDNILLEKLDDEGDSKNKLYLILSADVITMLNDLLTFPNGPRLRDKLSHGEVRLDDMVFSHLCHHLIHVLVHVLIKLKDYLSLDISDISSVQNLNFIDPGLYSPKFHLISVVKRSIEESIQAVKKRDSPQTPAGLTTQHIFTDVEHDLNLFLLAIEKERYSVETVQPSFELLDEFLQLKVLSRHCSMLKDAELMKYLMQIANTLPALHNNTQKSLEENHALWSEFKLRQRGRKTFTKILQIVPVLRLCLFSILYLIICNFITACLGLDTPSPLRDVKNVLSATQNIHHYTLRTVNRWTEILRTLQTVIVPVLKRFKIEKLQFEPDFR